MVLKSLHYAPLLPLPPTVTLLHVTMGLRLLLQSDAGGPSVDRRFLRRSVLRRF